MTTKNNSRGTGDNERWMQPVHHKYMTGGAMIYATLQGAPYTRIDEKVSLSTRPRRSASAWCSAHKELSFFE